jgi:hypothetical protein
VIGNVVDGNMLRFGCVESEGVGRFDKGIVVRMMNTQQPRAHVLEREIIYKQGGERVSGIRGPGIETPSYLASVNHL